MHAFSNTTTSPRIALLALLTVGLALPVHADRITSYTYNTLGLVETIDGPRIDVSDVTTYGYDAQGNRTLIRDALGHETQITAHDAAGRPLTLIDPNGLTTQLNYDPRGRLIGQAVSDGTITHNTSYTYDPVGNLTGVTLPDGSTLVYVHDAANRLIGLRDELDNRIDYTLDAMGNRVNEQVSDTNSILFRTSQRAYDELGRLIQLLDAENQTTAYAYDANGNLTQQTDARFNPTGHLYDALDRLKQTTDALNGLTGYTYDSQNNLTSVTDPNGLTTTYTYDGLGNLINQTSPDTGMTTYTYDEAGNRLSQTDARGVTVSYTYDALNRLTGIQYPDPTLNVSFGYDQGTHGIGRLTRMTDIEGTTEYGYDTFGQLVSETYTEGTLITAFYSAYDSAGRLTSFTYPSGHTILYGYDSLGQVSDLTLEKPDASLQPLAINFQRLPFGPLQSLDYGNGLKLSRNFDQNYRLIAQTIPGILSSSYKHDPVGNIIDWVDLLDTGRDQLFDYDALDRLVSASGLYGSLSFDYDATGNRLSFTQDLNTDSYQYAIDSHRLLDILGSHPETRTYDAVGNTLQSALGNTVYDDTNRVVQYTRAGVVAEYAYNGKGERIRKTVNGQTTHFRYGPNAQLLGEYDDSGNPMREYVYLEGQPLAQLSFSSNGVPDTTSPTTSHCRQWKTKQKHTTSRNKHRRNRMVERRSDNSHRKTYLKASDTQSNDESECCIASIERLPGFSKRHGRKTSRTMIECREKHRGEIDRYVQSDTQSDTMPDLLNVSLAYLHTDHLGTVVKATDENQHLVWDAVLQPFGVRNIISNQIVMPLGFLGQYYDEESGMFYNYFRDYDPATGRYLESDPIGLSGGLNTYAYVYQNPLAWTDRFGLFGDGTAYGPTADPNGPKGHSDFPGADVFDYTAEDYGSTNPYLKPWNHFKDLFDVENDLSMALTRCDKGSFQSYMHQGQDYFTHYRKGFRWYLGGHILMGTVPDKDISAWIMAKNWTQQWFDKWNQNCCN